MAIWDDDYDGVQYDTFNDGPPVCRCGRLADYDGRRCCLCAPAESRAHEAHELALAGRCSHGGHGWEGTCSDIDDALAGRRPRLSPAEELAAEFGTDVSEWTV